MAAPLPYGFVGDGNMSRHWRHYFSSLGIPWRLWSRRPACDRDAADAGDPAMVLADCQVILLAVSDDAVEPVLQQLRGVGLVDRSFVHFCGGRSYDGSWGAHPLMTFSKALYPPAFYRDIPIFAEANTQHPDPVARFRELFPLLPNPCLGLPTADRALYHALCALAGGLTSVLWRDFLDLMAERFNAPRALLSAYPRRIIDNVLESADGALTGPVARGDTRTIEAHLDALEDCQLRGLYQAFIKVAGRKLA